MSNANHIFQVSPIRSLREFIEGNEWSTPNLNPKEFDNVQKQAISNLIYFQTNYGIVFIPFLLLVGYFRPAAILLDLFVIALLLVVHFYLTREKTIVTQAISNLIYFQTNYGIVFIPFLLLVGYFRPAAILLDLFVIALLLVVHFYLTREKTIVTVHFRNRPILILILLLIVAFMIIRMFSSVWVFLVGIVLPLTLIVIHATVRKPSIQNKATNAVENLSLQASPMGLVLGWLGLKSIDDQSKSSTQSK
ncbi:unnamed protein product [Rotaria sp. Silwood1]|nr:unnamed protein product [Rotaria sp. Silwood1]